MSASPVNSSRESFLSPFLSPSASICLASAAAGSGNNDPGPPPFDCPAPGGPPFPCGSCPGRDWPWTAFSRGAGPASSTMATSDRASSPTSQELDSFECSPNALQRPIGSDRIRVSATTRRVLSGDEHILAAMECNNEILGECEQGVPSQYGC